MTTAVLLDQLTRRAASFHRRYGTNATTILVSPSLYTTFVDLADDQLIILHQSIPYNILLSADVSTDEFKLVLE